MKTPVRLLTPPSPQRREVRFRSRRLQVSRFESWQRHASPSTVALVRLLRLVIR
jgi:hypothetical protein